MPRRTTVASIVYEQAIAATSAVVFSAYFFITHPDLEGQPLRFAVLLLIPARDRAPPPAGVRPAGRTALLGAFGREPLPAVISMRGVIGLLAFYLLNWVVITIGTYCVARSVSNVPIDEMLTVGSAQALGYVAALATLVAPAGLGDPGRRLRLGGEGGRAGRQLRGRLADRDRRARRADGGRGGLRGRGDRARPPPGLEHPHRRPAPLARGGGGREVAGGRGAGGDPGPAAAART